MKNMRNMEINKIYCGDTFQLLKDIPNDYIDLVVTSPPYANMTSYGKEVKTFNSDNYVDWIIPLFKEAPIFLKSTGSFILNINDKIVNGERCSYVYELIYRIQKETNLKFYDRYIWYKKSSLPTAGDKRLIDRIEYLFHFVRDAKLFKSNLDELRVPYSDVSLKRFNTKMHGNDIIGKKGKTNLSNRYSKANPKGAKPTNVFRFDNCSAIRNLNHPAPFHPQLPSFFIKWLTDKKDIVLDPFIGVGNTAIACNQLDRNYIGFEINQTYIDIANERLKKLEDQKRL